MAETHRLLRVMEYVGTPEFIRLSIERRGVKGRKDIPGRGYISEAIIGETAEVLAADTGFTSPEDTPLPLEG